MTDHHASRVKGLAALKNLFGDNRAEWPPDRFPELFVEPAYFRKLESRRPSLLVGGRGTGKTTALRSLRFNSTLERLEATGLTFNDQEYLGIFVRIDKNRVHAFKGDALSPDMWRKAFAHYFNLLATVELAELADWLTAKSGLSLSQDALSAICSDLGISLVSTLGDLRASIKRSISDLQIFVNNPDLTKLRPAFSIAEAPVRTMASVLHDSGLTEERTIFCCIDEYENLLDDQQAVLNTYIKHAEPPLSYKVGVRKNGLRNRQTIAGTDPLRTPDDFEEIDIATEGFEYFAEKVASLRLSRAREQGVNVPPTLGEFLQELSISSEALLLGAETVAEKVLTKLQAHPDLHAAFSQKPASETYFLQYWAASEKTDVETLARDWLADESKWKNRLNNYGYASIFWLSHGRKGARTRKYYCGARTFLALPAGNIRYFLELIDQAIGEETAEGHSSQGELLTLSPLAQTNAAKAVGYRRLEQIEGLAERGVELKRLVLAIGKVFFELARSPLGRTPEVTSFVLSGEGEVRTKVVSLLNEGAASLCFEVTPRTKPTNPLEMRDDEYRLHPIFCAFFEISHRRKRRTTFKASDLMLALEKPSQAISHLLDGGSQAVEDELPEQLAFFSSFFEGGTK